MANNISKPLGNLSKAAMKIGAGDFAQKIAIPNSRDEVRDLANAFDKMIKDLEKTTVSKDYLDNIIESTLDCIVISKKGYVFMVNSAFAQTLGYNKEELKGKAMLEFMPIKEGTYTSTTGELVQIDKNYCDDLMRTYDQLFEEGKVSNKETFFIGKDQKVIPVETNIVLLYNKDRALTGVLRSIRDLTVRKMAENKLRAYNDFVENILRTCPDGIMVINNGYILTVNSGVEKMLGYTQKELIGDHIKILAPQDEMPDSVTELHRKINETGFLKNQELLWRRKDGSLLPVENHFTRLNDRNGNVLGTLIITRDITERKQAEEALSRAHDELERKVEVRTAELTESNEQLNLEITERKQIEVKLKNTTEQLSILLESLPIIPYTCKAGRDFVLTYIGNRVEEITGYKVNQCIEDSSFWVKHIHPDDQDMVGSAFQELYKCGENNYQYRFRVADGSYKWFNNIQRLIKLPDGTVSHITGSLQDITEGKRLRQESEHRLQQIIQSDKLASLGKIVAGVAHEINNPNSFVIYNLPLLEETWEVVEPILTDYARTHPGWEVNGVCLDELSQDMKEIIDAIRSGSKRINSVVTNLKDYVRLHEVLDFIPVQVNDVVKKALTMVESQIKRYGSKRVLKLADTLPEIPGYFHKLEQVLVNLLVNATDAVATKDDGKISITTRYLVRLATVLIEIEDNGEGMEPLTIDRIFEPFFTTRLGTGGTGLGLSVSHSLVKEHNGNIGILSQKGVGSRFTVFLPVSRETELKIYPSILCLNYDVEFIDELRISSGEYVDGFLQALSKPDSLISYLEEHPEVDIVLFNSMILDAHSDLKLLEEIKKRFPLLTVIMCSDPQTVLNKKKGTAQPDYLLKKPFKMNELLEIINTIGRQRL
jgi:PAS domain S-box-containing protein